MNNSINSKFILSTEGIFSELETIRSFVRKIALEAGLNDEEAFNVALAVDEACTNIIKYSYKEELNHQIQLDVLADKFKLEVNIYDDGPSFNLMNMPEINTQEYFDKAKKGGLGIHIIKQIIDEIEYYPASESSSKNTLKLIKNFH